MAAAGLLAALGWFGYPRWVQRQHDQAYEACFDAQTGKRWRELERLATEWSKWEPHSADPWIFRADAVQQQGNFVAAATFLGSVPEADPKYLLAQLRLAALQFGPMNRPLEGAVTCEQILKREPRSFEAHRHLIEFYAVTLQREKLLRAIDEAIRVSSEPLVAYIYLLLIDTMRVGNATELNRLWLEAAPGTEMFLVAEAVQMPEPEGGIANSTDKHQIIETMLERFPANLELRAYLVDLAIRRGDINELVEVLQGVSNGADRDARFWRAKGWLHLNRNEPEKARAALEQALKFNPLDWDARNWLADLTRNAGNLAEADRLQGLVRQARKLREKIRETSFDQLPRETFTEIADYARACGATTIADALQRRVNN